MREPKLKGKSYVIPKRLLWEAWLKVKENGGAAGADGVTIEQCGVSEPLIEPSHFSTQR